MIDCKDSEFKPELTIDMLNNWLKCYATCIEDKYFKFESELSGKMFIRLLKDVAIIRTESAELVFCGKPAQVKTVLEALLG